jgi:putative endonuclease
MLSRGDNRTPVWYCYALRCADDTLYAGVTTDLVRRIAQHNAGRGARYTAGRRPVRLVAAWQYPDRGAAQRAEARFRRLTRAQKLALIAQNLPFEGAPFCPSAQEDGTGSHKPVLNSTTQRG